jgi:hypothetical protein
VVEEVLLFGVVVRSGVRPGFFDEFESEETRFASTSSGSVSRRFFTPNLTALLFNKSETADVECPDARPLFECVTRLVILPETVI